MDASAHETMATLNEEKEDDDGWSIITCDTIPEGFWDISSLDPKVVEILMRMCTCSKELRCHHHRFGLRLRENKYCNQLRQVQSAPCTPEGLLASAVIQIALAMSSRGCPI